jgi:hypothetical protein
MTNWLEKNKRKVIRLAFVVPILLVAAISVSHVVRWYDLANPVAWAIYLSIAVEIAAMSALAAASVRVKGYSIWLVFVIVTLIQFIGNVFFSFTEIDSSAEYFKSWVELTAPVFDAMGSDITDIVAQKRWLALLAGGLLPIISLTCLHFFIEYGHTDDQSEEIEKVPEVSEIITESPEEVIPVEPIVVDPIAEHGPTRFAEPTPDQVQTPESEINKKRPAHTMSAKMQKITGR